MADKSANVIGKFIVENVKPITACIVFICGMYVQYQASMMRIERIEKEIIDMQRQLDAQYTKLDNIKLDKAVFEATIKQFTDMSEDIRQIRDRLEDMMGDNRHVYVHEK